MKAVIVGAGKACRSLIGLIGDPVWQSFDIQLVSVVEHRENAPGLAYADQAGLKTFADIKEALSSDDIELVIELTGDDTVLQDLYKNVKPGMKIIDHTITKIFWDAVNTQADQRWQLIELEKLELEISNERIFLKSIFDGIADPAVVLDTQGRIIRANTKFLTFSNLPFEKVLNRECQNIIKVSGIECSKSSCESCIKEMFVGGVARTELLVVPPPEEAYWEKSRSPVFNDHHEVIAVLATWHRITDRIKLQRKIDVAESQFTSFINSAKDWISIKDLNGRYMTVNPIIADAFDMKQEDFINRSPEEILPSKLSKMIRKNDMEVIRRKKDIFFNEIIRVKGVDNHFQTIRFPLFDHRQNVTGVCTIARNVSKEVQLQEQLIQTEKLAAIGKLAAGVAHEINNPLTGILAFAEDLIEEYTESDFQYADLSVIIRETLRCRDIVRNLLDFSRQDKPNFEISKADVIAGSTLNLIEKLPQFKDINIKRCFDEAIPFIKCDPKQLNQVLLNFLLNAADAMKSKGQICLRTAFEPRKNKCVISVEDNGPGIPENMVDKIFEPFFSTKNTNGLGLAVSWGIVERHGGVIEVDMSETGGAIFRIVLPAIAAE